MTCDAQQRPPAAWGHCLTELQVVELTSTAVTFLEQTFTDFDEDGDDCLSAHEQACMYDTAPELPWHQQPPLRVSTSQAVLPVLHAAQATADAHLT